jgi:hypothetical protein
MICDVCDKKINPVEVGDSIHAGFNDEKFISMFGKKDLYICLCCKALSMGVKIKA